MKKIFLVLILFFVIASPVFSKGNDSDTVLLIQSDTANGSSVFADTSVGGNGGASHTVSGYGGITHSTVQAKTGSSSIYFDGSGDYLYVPTHQDFNLAGNDFTIDFWVYPQVRNGYNYFLSMGRSTSFGNAVYTVTFYNTTDIAFGFNGTWNHLYASNQNANNQWRHIAVVRSGSSLYMFVNGVRRSTYNIGNTAIDFRNDPLRIGKFCDWTGGWYKGFLDEFRISKVARWTADFTPQTVSYSEPSPIKYMVFKSGVSFNAGSGVVIRKESDT